MDNMKPNTTQAQATDDDCCPDGCDMRPTDDSFDHAFAFPEFDGVQMVAVEQCGRYAQRCWYGSGPRDHYNRYTPAMQQHQAAIYCAHLSHISIIPQPVGSRFD